MDVTKVKVQLGLPRWPIIGSTTVRFPPPSMHKGGYGVWLIPQFGSIPLYADCVQLLTYTPVLWWWWARPWQFHVHEKLKEAKPCWCETDNKLQMSGLINIWWQQKANRHRRFSFPIIRLNFSVVDHRANTAGFFNSAGMMWPWNVFKIGFESNSFRCP